MTMKGFLIYLAAVVGSSIVFLFARAWDGEAGNGGLYFLSVIVFAGLVGLAVKFPVWLGVGPLMAVSHYVAFAVFAPNPQADQFALLPVGLAVTAALGTAAAAASWGLAQRLSLTTATGDKPPGFGLTAPSTSHECPAPFSGNSANTLPEATRAERCTRRGRRHRR